MPPTDNGPPRPLAPLLPTTPHSNQASRTTSHLLARDASDAEDPRAREETADLLGGHWDYDVCESERADLGDE